MRQSRWVVLSILVAVLAAGGGYIARAAGAGNLAQAFGKPEPPPGVSADQWFPIGDSLGVVIDDPAAARARLHRLGTSSPPDLRLLLMISTPGHLLAKIDGVWITLDVKAPIGGVLPAN
jgi:hypothetical protein